MRSPFADQAIKSASLASRFSGLLVLAPVGFLEPDTEFRRAEEPWRCHGRRMQFTLRPCHPCGRTHYRPSSEPIYSDFSCGVQRVYSLAPRSLLGCVSALVSPHFSSISHSCPPHGVRLLWLLGRYSCRSSACATLLGPLGSIACCGSTSDWMRGMCW